MIIVLTTLACAATVLLSIALIVTSQKKISLEAEVQDLRKGIKDLHLKLKEAQKAAMKAFPLNNRSYIPKECREDNTLSFKLIKVLDHHINVRQKGVSYFLVKVTDHEKDLVHFTLLKGKLPDNYQEGQNYTVYIEETLADKLIPPPKLKWYKIDRAIEITEIK